MANELSLTYTGSSTVYAIIRRMTDNYVWQTTTSTFVAWEDANIANYDLPLTDRGGDVYTANSPSSLVVGVEYRIIYYEQAGGSPAIADLLLTSEEGDWNGTSLASAGVGGSGDGNYLTVAELKLTKAIGGDSIDFSAYTDDELGELIAFAESMIESITGDIFYVLTSTIVVDGNNKPKLWFHPETLYKNLSVTTVTEVDDDGSTVLETFVENTDFKRYDRFLQMIGDDAPTARSRSFESEWWPKGNKNIKIVGTWGWAEVPPEIKRAVRMIVMADVNPTAFQLTPTNIAMSSWSDYMISFRSLNRSPLGFKENTGYAEIDRLLSRYINYGGLMYSV